MTTGEALLIKEAHERGFNSAIAIKPAHMIHHPNCPTINIPEDVELYVNSMGDCCFQQKGTNISSFTEEGKEYAWAAIVYYNKTGQWAEIVTHRVGNTEWKSKTIGELSEFPSEGVCWQPTKELRDYLLARSNSSTTACGFHVKGIAWNYNSCWEVASYSGKTEYKIEHLMRFIPPNIPEHLNQRPMTPDECYEFPEKWFIMIDKENVYDVQDFLIAKKDEYVGYTDTWKPSPGGSLLYPQHTRWAYGITGRPLEKGYTEITFEQFKKHVLTHTEGDGYTPQKVTINKVTVNNKPINLEEDGKSRESRESTKGESCKVQRPHLSIRGGSEIRADSIGCSKVKIQVRDGYSPDSL